jgi:hypothetical protein
MSDNNGPATAAHGTVEPSTACNVENIPKDVSEVAKFVCWVKEWTGKKWNKKPVNLHGRATDATKPELGLILRLCAAQLSDTTGLGVILGQYDERWLGGVDFDSCRDRAAGAVQPWVQPLLDSLPGAYVELSPTGTGIRVLFWSSRPFKFSTVLIGGAKVEAWSEKRYVTLTGNLVGPAVETLPDLTDQFEAFAAAAAAASAPSAAAAAAGAPPAAPPAAPPKPKRAAVDPWQRELALEACEHFLVTRWRDREQWWGIGGGLHHTDPSAGMLMEWIRLSQKHAPDCYDDGPGGCVAQWATMKQEREGKGVYTLKHLLQWAKEDTGWEPDCRRTIRATTDLRCMADLAVEQLAHDPCLFQRANRLVHVVNWGKNAETGRLKRDPDAPRIIGVENANLMERLSTFARWERVKQNRKGEWSGVPCLPPEPVVKAVQARRVWTGVRRLDGVVTSPVLRPDGTVLTEPGYDDETGLLYTGGLSVEVGTTREDAAAAAETLLELVKHFPFVSPSHRSAWLCHPLTVVARAAIDGCTPLHVFDANTARVGKTLLVKVSSLIATGLKAAQRTADIDDAEMRKLLTSVVIAGDRMVHFDNANKPFGCGPLDAAITSGVLADRHLGGNEAPSLPFDAVVSVTGNNIVLAKDSPGRSLYCRQKCDMEHPEERKGLPDVEREVRENRGKYLGACLTVESAYLRSGERVELPPFGGFEAWSRVVREAVVWAGQPDPLGARTQLREEAVPRRDYELILLTTIHAVGRPVSASDLSAMCATDAVLRLAIIQLFGGWDGIAIGHGLLGLKDHTVETLQLNRVGKKNVGVVWTVRKVESGQK